MQLSNEWRLSADPRQFILENLAPVTNKHTKETRYEWKEIGYYGSVEQLERAINTYLVKDAVGMDTFAKFLKAYKAGLASISLIRSPEAGPE